MLSLEILCRPVLLDASNKKHFVFPEITSQKKGIFLTCLYENTKGTVGQQICRLASKIMK